MLEMKIQDSIVHTIYSLSMKRSIIIKTISLKEYLEEETNIGDKREGFPIIGQVVRMRFKEKKSLSFQRYRLIQT